jgi:hypothetical protein
VFDGAGLDAGAFAANVPDAIHAMNKTVEITGLGVMIAS